MIIFYFSFTCTKVLYDTRIFTHTKNICLRGNQFDDTEQQLQRPMLTSNCKKEQTSKRTERFVFEIETQLFFERFNISI